MTKYELPPLNYAYNALEPYLDAKTVEIHYTKHHQAYLDNMNAILEKYPKMQNESCEDLLRNLPSLAMEETDKVKFKNNAGGYCNHNLYWKVMGPKKEIDQALNREIKRTFASVEEFKKIFTEKSQAHFASGWAWLVYDENNQLKIYTLPNHESPYTLGHIPVLVLDLWEHAYYLKYQNRRPEYIQNWWSILKLI